MGAGGKTLYVTRPSRYLLKEGSRASSLREKRRRGEESKGGGGEWC
jgi:hypothetical protein